MKIKKIMIDKHKISSYLTYLDQQGWSELIDERWKKDVYNELKNEFPDMSNEEWNYMCEFLFW